MVAVKKDLYIEQGATFQFWLRWLETDENGQPSTPIDLTGWTARMDIRRAQRSAALVSATTETGEISITGDQGVIAIRLSPKQTDMITSATALYDLELVTTGGDVYRILQGKVTVDPNITQATGDPAVT